AESAFRENDWATVRDALETAITMEDPGERVAQLATLEGVDVGVGSGMLYMLNPSDDIVMGEREWAALEALDERSEGYPSTPRPSDYRDYHATCARLRDELGVTFIDLQRTLWRLSAGDEA
ncbi:MAG: hypothetical protein ACOC0X_06105, partial [Halobacteriota archaeon]